MKPNTLTQKGLLRLMSLLTELQQLKLYVNGKIHTRIQYVLQNKHPRLLNRIIKHTNFLSSDSTMSERIYCIEHNISSPVLCKYCGESTTKYLSNKKCYAEYCSTKCATNSPQVQQARIDTNLKVHGVTNPSKNKKIHEKKIQTLQKNYGVDNFRDSEIINSKREETNLSRYGHVNPFGSKQIQEKIKNQNIQNYGTEYVGSRSLTPTQLKLLNDRNWLIEQHHTLNNHIKTIAANIDVDPTTVSNYCRKHNITIINFAFSAQEREIVEFIQSIYSGDVITNSRDIIPPLELDIVIPEKKIAIEYCGLYWHSTKFKDKQYHANKIKLCTDQGYRLITMFEDEWKYRQDIIKSKLKYLLYHPSVHKIYARKCTVENIDTTTKRLFLDTNHLQGNARSSIAYGMWNNSNLVAVMAFQRERDKVILTRYCSKQNYAIVGAFNKLLSKFIQQHPNTCIVSFADLRWSNGNVYSKNGFELDGAIPPDYTYIVGDTRRHKFGYRHKHLPKKLKVYDPNLSENANMQNNNILKIYDCGKLRFCMYTGPDI